MNLSRLAALLCAQAPRQRWLLVLFLVYGFFALVLPPLRRWNTNTTYGDSLPQAIIIDAMRQPGRMGVDLLARHSYAYQPPVMNLIYRALTFCDGRKATLVLQALASLTAIMATLLVSGAAFRHRPWARWMTAFFMLRVLSDTYLLRAGAPRAFLLPFYLLWLWAALKQSPAKVLGVSGALALVYPPGFLLTGAATPFLPWVWGWRGRLWFRQTSIFIGMLGCMAALLSIQQHGAVKQFGAITMLASNPQHEAFVEKGRFDGVVQFEHFGNITLWGADTILTSGGSLLDKLMVRPTGMSVRWIFGPIVLVLMMLPLLRKRLEWRSSIWHAMRPSRASLRLIAVIGLSTLVLYVVVKSMMLRYYYPSRYLICPLFVGFILLPMYCIHKAWRGAWLLIPTIAILFTFNFGKRIHPGNDHFRRARNLYDYLKTHAGPTDLVAGDPNFMDALTQNASVGVVACWEMAQPYYSDYWREHAERIRAMGRACYSASQQDLIVLREQYKARYLVVNLDPDDLALTPQSDAFEFEPFHGELIRFSRAQSAPPAWKQLLASAIAYQDKNYMLVDLRQVAG